MVRYNCEHCGTLLESSRSLRGQTDICPACGHTCVVPEATGRGLLPAALTIGLLSFGAVVGGVFLFAYSTDRGRAVPDVNVKAQLETARESHGRHDVDTGHCPQERTPNKPRIDRSHEAESGPVAVANGKGKTKPSHSPKELPPRKPKEEINHSTESLDTAASADGPDSKKVAPPKVGQSEQSEQQDRKKLSTRELARRALESVVMLVMQDEDGQPKCVGSGFFVDDSVVATNVHVVTGASHGYWKFAGENGRRPVAGVLALDVVHDLVLLQVGESNAPPMRLGRSKELRTGDSIFVAGNPHGLEGTVSNGIVSAVRELKSGKLLQVTAPMSPGSSGGPVLNEYGEVVGVAVASVEEGQNLNFAIPSVYLGQLLQLRRKLMSFEESVGKLGTGAKSETPGRRLASGVKVSHISWGGGHFVEFSLRNRLQRPVREIRMRVIFYAEGGEPVHFEDSIQSRPIPPGLGMVHKVNFWERATYCRRLLGSPVRSKDNILQTEHGWVEVRVLDFHIPDQ